MKIAAATYPIDWHENWASYEAKIIGWVSGAARSGADLLVFPEYGAMELASLDGARVAGGVESSLRAVDALRDRANALYAALALQFSVHILGASAPCYDGHARPSNRAVLFTPDGTQFHQDKQVMTRFERHPMDVRSRNPLVVFDTKLGKIGVVICYDAEFPLLARALVEAGVEILLAPSCTETLAGYWRVRIGAMARALEGQCIVVHSPTTGNASWNPVVGNSTGTAAIYGPPDIGFPETGILAEGVMNEPGWVFADVSLDAIRNVRANGRVLNVTHWEEQAERISTIPVAGSSNN